MKNPRYLFLAAVLVAAPVYGQNLITNGDFSNGLADWNPTGDVGPTTGEVPPGADFGAAYNGGDSTPNGVLSQSFATTAGDAYSASFGYNTFFGSGYGIDQNLNATIAGSSVLSDLFYDGPSTADGTQMYTVNFVADSASTTITFADDATNDTISEDGILTNVSVVTVPDGAPTALLLAIGAGCLALAGVRRRAVAQS